MPIVFAAGAVVTTIGLSLIGRRTIARVALRDFFRRPGQSLLIISGLLVSSVVLSAALVAGDATESMFLTNVYRVWGPIDMVVGTLSGRPFDEAEARRIIANPEIQSLADARSVRLQVLAGAESPAEGTRESQVNLIGIDPNGDASLGSFTGIDGAKLEDPANTVFINERLSERLKIKQGSELLLVTSGFDTKPATLRLVVGQVVRNDGKADFQLRPNAFVSLGLLQQSLRGKGKVNEVILSANGPDRAPEQVRRLELTALRVAHRAAPDQTIRKEDFVYRIAGAKAQSIKSAKEQSRFFRNVLGALGAIVALTSVALIANLFVILGEERRAERGMMRALGLKRGGMLLLGLAEGLFYSITAAAAGALAGAFLGRSFARSLVGLYGQFLEEFAVDFAIPEFEFRFETLLVAASAGFLVSVFSVAFITWRTSRFSVVAAIRGLSEEGRVSRSRSVLVHTVLMLIGAGLLFFTALRSFDGAAIAQLLGGTLFIVGFAALLRRLANPRFAVTFGALAVIGWSLWGYVYLPDFENEFDTAFAVVTTAAVLVVVASVVLTATNLTVLERAGALFGPRGRAVVRTATAYPVGYRFRTASSMLMFALVLYMIAAFAIWGALGSGDFRAQSGGYDVLATSTVPVPDLQVPEAERITPFYSARYELGYRVENSPEVRFPVSLYGADAGMASSTFRFTDKLEGLSDAAVWERLSLSKDEVILDTGTIPGSVQAGQILEINTDKGPRRLTIIGIVDEFWLSSIFVSKPTFTELYPNRAANAAWLIKAKPGTSAETLVTSVERSYSGLGLDAQSVRRIFDDTASAQRTFIGLFQVLLRLGLVIGITGLAIASVRTVLERRHAVGVMRALGFKRYMVGVSLLLEAVLVATLGCVIGLGAGLAGTYLLMKEQLTTVRFNADWFQIWTTLAIVYGAVFVFTSLPALRAALLRPAEAVRYVE